MPATIEFNYEPYIRLIAKLANQHWRRLPPEYQQYIDVDDFIQEGIVHVIRKAHLYDHTQSKESTFLQVILTNFYNGMVKRYQHPSHYQPCDPLPDTIPCVDATRFERVAYAEVRVNRLLELASPGLRKFLARRFFGDGFQAGFMGTEKYDKIVLEFRRLVRITNVTVEDFMYVRAASVRI